MFLTAKGGKHPDMASLSGHEAAGWALSWNPFNIGVLASGSDDGQILTVSRLSFVLCSSVFDLQWDINHGIPDMTNRKLPSAAGADGKRPKCQLFCS